MSIFGTDNNSSRTKRTLRVVGAFTIVASLRTRLRGFAIEFQNDINTLYFLGGLYAVKLMIS